MATTYDFNGQAVDLYNIPYTAADTLNLTNVTFTSQYSRTLPPLLNLSAGTTTFATSDNLTLTGGLTGSGSLVKSSTPTLTLTGSGASFTGPVSLNAGLTRLTNPQALGTAAAPTPITLSGSLDVSGSIPERPVLLAGGALRSSSATAVTIGPALSIAPSPATAFTLGFANGLTFATPLAAAYSLTISGNAGATATYSTPTAFSNGVTVSNGTLRLGIESPFAGSSGVTVNGTASYATLDLNGFNSPGAPVTFNGGTLINDNTASTSTLSTLPAGTLSLGGQGNINLAAPLPSTATLLKGGYGTLAISSSNPAFAGTVVAGKGTLRLERPDALGNSPATSFTLSGSIDLNGYAAPAGNYMLNDGSFVNNNTSTPSTIGSNVTYNTYWGHNIGIGGAGDIVAPEQLPSSVGKFGAGTLTLDRPAGITAALGINQGTVRLGNANALLAGSSLELGPQGALDLNGFPFPAGVPVTFYDYDNGALYGGGIVNNNTATPVTLGPGFSFTYEFQARNPSFGGNGTLRLDFGPLPPTNIGPAATLNKVGAGLLTLGTSFTSNGAILRAGTLQVESDSQLGGPLSTISFAGGTLRVAPLLLPPAPSYTLTSALSLNPANPTGAVDTQRDTTLTGAFSGTGTLAKLGPASLTLPALPPSTITLDLREGALRFPSPTTTADDVRQSLAAGRLTTSAPDPTHSHSLGYLSTSDATLVELSLTGDANLDGVINADDFALLDQGFAAHASTWSQGDFNYDGTVDQNDYLLIDTAFCQAQGFSPGFLAERESQFGADYVQALVTSVPEPTSLLAACGFALLPLSRRRRRRR